MTREEADKLVAEQGLRCRGGCRAGLAPGGGLPKPVSIVEIKSIRDMVAAGLVVVACGGGVSPVFKTDGHHLKGRGRRHRQGLRSLYPGPAAGCRLPYHPHRSGKGGHSLRKAERGMALP